MNQDLLKFSTSVTGLCSECSDIADRCIVCVVWTLRIRSPKPLAEVQLLPASEITVRFVQYCLFMSFHHVYLVV